MAEGVAVPTGTQPTNLACAIAVALALGVEVAAVSGRLASLPSVDHRLQAARSAAGAIILDDTYNSNPAGAAEALDALRLQSLDAEGSATGRRVVVTPGMVELGPRQSAENRAFGAAIAAVADHLIIVGRTNRRALQRGVADAGASGLGVDLVLHREQAVAWVRDHLGPQTWCCTRTICRTTTLDRLRRPTGSAGPDGDPARPPAPHSIGGVPPRARRSRDLRRTLP